MAAFLKGDGFFYACNYTDCQFRCNSKSLLKIHMDKRHNTNSSSINRSRLLVLELSTIRKRSWHEIDCAKFQSTPQRIANLLANMKTRGRLLGEVSRKGGHIRVWLE